MSRIRKKSYLSLLAGVTIACIVLNFNGCKIYSFTGASICPEAKTVSISYFKNNAPLVQPTLSQKLTDELRDKFSSQTNLNLVSYGGDLNFEGKITNYTTTPVAIQGNETAALNRLTITVQVKYTNVCDETKNFDLSFTRYQQYNSSLPLSSVEAGLIEKISKELVEDIFNKAVVNW